ncbi:MAG TPA: hypothetical protein PKM12_01345, partial [Marmoricola sp.]|nr:hypothetical protein [Marmoricola sp.]
MTGPVEPTGGSLRPNYNRSGVQMNTKQITAAIGALSAALILTSCGSGGSTGPGLKLVAQQLEPFQSCDQ